MYFTQDIEIFSEKNQWFLRYNPLNVEILHCFIDKMYIYITKILYGSCRTSSVESIQTMILIFGFVVFSILGFEFSLNVKIHLSK